MPNYDKQFDNCETKKFLGCPVSVDIFVQNELYRMVHLL